MLNSLEWSNLEEREKRHLLITMFKVFNNNCPTYLQEYFYRTSEVHNYNLRGLNYDFQLQTITNYVLSLIEVQMLGINCQIKFIREIRDLASFKRAIS